MLFGPAETGEKLYKEIKVNHPELNHKVKEMIKADSMTKKQVKAWVRKYYDIEKVKAL